MDTEFGVTMAAGEFESDGKRQNVIKTICVAKKVCIYNVWVFLVRFKKNNYLFS